jgi:hypothetical protein
MSSQCVSWRSIAIFMYVLFCLVSTSSTVWLLCSECFLTLFCQMNWLTNCFGKWQLHERRNADKCWGNPIGMSLFFRLIIMPLHFLCAWKHPIWQTSFSNYWLVDVVIWQINWSILYIILCRCKSTITPTYCCCKLGIHFANFLVGGWSLEKMVCFFCGSTFLSCPYYMKPSHVFGCLLMWL